MARDRTTLRSNAPAVERRRVGPAVAQRSPAAAVAARSPAAALRDRIGNRAAPHVARAIAAPAKVSKPTDPAEREAEETARKVVRMREPAATSPAGPREAARGLTQRAEAPPLPAPAAPAPRLGIGGGSPLPPAVRSAMEPRFGASFANVRVHTGEAAAQQSAQLGAAAFTLGEHIFFGRNRFQPQSAGGQELIAHELTHTIQQGAAAQADVAHRSPAMTVSEQVGPQVQRFSLGLPDPREYFADKAALIPGYSLATVVFGFNPISGARVERSPVNILRGAIQLIPGGALITQVLEAHGLLEKIALWAAGQFEALKDLGSSTLAAIEAFIKQFSATDLLDPGGLWDRAKALVQRPIEKVIGFAVALKDGIVRLIKDAILQPIAAFARTTSGYPLLCTVLGHDPITGEKVPQDAEALLGGFMTFIGQGELWATMQKAHAVPRAFAWFRGAVAAVKAFVAQIPGMFVQAFRSLEVADLLLIPRAFQKLAGVFGGFVGRFVAWGADAVWKLLEIVFDVVSPGALAYVKKAGAALRSILQNPIPFVLNLVRAAKQGFLGFAENLLGHLKTGLLEWLTGALPGVYIPKALSLVEIAKFAFSALQIGWPLIRQKVVKVLGEPAVKAMETGFDLVVTLVRDGPAAAWEKIKEQLANLKDMVIGGITDFVVDTVVKKAVPKLISMFIPGAGFISAILSIYDTVMVFVEKLSRIAQVVSSFVESIASIAAGAVGAAAKRVETTLAGLLSLAISFLAGFVGLGNVGEKVRGVIERARSAVGKAIDWLVGWIVVAAKKLGKLVAAGGRGVWSWFAKHRQFSADGEAHETWLDEQGEPQIASRAMSVGTRLAGWRKRAEGLPDDEKKPARDKLAEATRIHAELKAAARRALKARSSGNAAAVEQAQKAIDAAQDELVSVLASLFVLFGDTKGPKKPADEARMWALVEAYDRVVVPLIEKKLVASSKRMLSSWLKDNWKSDLHAWALGLETQMARVLEAAKRVGTGRFPYLVGVEVYTKAEGKGWIDYTVRERDDLELPHGGGVLRGSTVAVEVKRWGPIKGKPDPNISDPLELIFRHDRARGPITVRQEIEDRLARLTHQVEGALKDSRYSGVIVEIRGYHQVPQEMRAWLLLNFLGYRALAYELGKSVVQKILN